MGHSATLCFSLVRLVLLGGVATQGKRTGNRTEIDPTGADMDPKLESFRFTGSFFNDSGLANKNSSVVKLGTNTAMH